ERLKQLGFENELQPIKVSCADHEGTRTGRIQTWDGKKWNIASDWITADDSVIAPMVKEAAAKYAAEKKNTTGCGMTNGLSAMPHSLRDPAAGTLLKARFGREPMSRATDSIGPRS